MKYDKINTNAVEYYKNPTEKNAEKLIKSFDRYIWKVAQNKSRKFKGMFSADEIYAAGMEGLWIAITKFDGRETFFSYGLTWVLSKIQRLFENNMCPFSVDKGAVHRNLAANYKKRMSKLRSEFPDKCTDELREIFADTHNIKLSKVYDIEIELTKPVYLDACHTDDRDVTGHDMLSKNSREEVENNVVDITDAKRLLTKINKHFSDFDDCNKAILWETVLNDYDSYREIGERFNMSRQAVHCRRGKILKRFEKFKKAV